MPALDLLYLQRAIGNRAVSSLVQRNPGEAAIPYAQGGAAPPRLEQRIRQNQSSGAPLPSPIQRKLESALGADLSQIKIHTDKNAVQLTRELGAKAFTVGKHIYYGEGQSPNNLKLTAHESVHAIQQGGAPRIQRDPETTSRDTEENEGAEDTTHEESSSTTLDDGYFRGGLSGSTRQSRSHSSGSSYSTPRPYSGSTSSPTGGYFESVAAAASGDYNYFRGSSESSGTSPQSSSSYSDSSEHESDQSDSPSVTGSYYGEGTSSSSSGKGKKGKKTSGLRWKLRRGKKKDKKAKSAPAPTDSSVTTTSGYAPSSAPTPAPASTSQRPSYYGGSQGDNPLEWGVDGRSRKRGKKGKGSEDQTKKPENDEPVLPDFEDRTLHRFEPDEFTFTIGVYRKVAEDFEFAQKRSKIVFRNELRRMARNSKLFGKFSKRFVREPKANEAIKLKAARQVLQEKALANNESLSTDDLDTQATNLAKRSADVGHTWVEFTTRYQGRLKTLYSFGMLPGGVQHPDRTTDGQGIAAPQFLDFKISRKAYQRAFNKAVSLYRRQPKYDVKDFNCTKFAQVLAQAAGVPFPAKAIVVPFYPKKGIKGLHHKAFMPGGLLEGMKGMKNIRTEATKEERTITAEEKQQEQVYNQTLQSIQNAPKNITGTGRFKNLKAMEHEYQAGEMAQQRVSKNGKEIGPMAYWRQRKNDTLGNLPVKYLDDIELAQYELTFNPDNNLFYWQGRIAHTEHMSQVAGFTNVEGRAIFVMTEDGKIYMADQAHEINASRDQKNDPQWLFHHSSFLRGKPVAAAGELIFVDGALKGITDASGHYRPSLTYTRQVLQRFADDHIDLSGVEVTLVEKGPDMPTITVNALELLNFSGDNEEDFRRQGLLKGVEKLLTENKFEEASTALNEILNTYSKQIRAQDIAKIAQKFMAASELKLAAIWLIRAHSMHADASYLATLETIARGWQGRGDNFAACRLYQWLYNQTKDPNHALSVVLAAEGEGAYYTCVTWTNVLETNNAGSWQAQQARQLINRISAIDLAGTRDDHPNNVPTSGEQLFKPGAYESRS